MPAAGCLHLSPTPTPAPACTHRKKKAVHKTTSTDDKRLQNTLKRLGVNPIPGIEEVNIFKDNSDVVHFTNPKGEGDGGRGRALPACGSLARSLADSG